MKIDGIDVQETITSANSYLEVEVEALASTGFKACFNDMLTLVTSMRNRLELNSSNSSIPPSSDPNRKKGTDKGSEETSQESKPKRKPGGQTGHEGTTLTKFESPDVIKEILVDPALLDGKKYKAVGFETRQVVDIECKQVVTEYRAQVLEDEQGNRIVAEFPKDVTRPVQYGSTLKAHAVYLSQHQLLPYNRVREYFSDQLNIPVSAGSLYNFNTEAEQLITELKIDERIKQNLIDESVINLDETGININGKRNWLHTASSPQWTWMHPHEKRGFEGINEGDIVINYKGVMCHDHWKTYFIYDEASHALCNAHHLRELTRAHEQDNQQWASEMHQFLKDTNTQVKEAGGVLSENAADKARQAYRGILVRGQIESPPPIKIKGKRGRPKKTKARNLLERLINYEREVLRFMTDVNVPFTNNLAENDIRMTKVHQKISGCFRSMTGAKTFTSLRSLLISSRKQGLTASACLTQLFNGQLPDIFVPSTG